MRGLLNFEKAYFESKNEYGLVFVAYATQLAQLIVSIMVGVRPVSITKTLHIV